MTKAPTPAELIRSARSTAVHLEMRDVYAVDKEDEEFKAWKAGHRDDPADPASWWRPWLTLIQEVTARGVVVRRARIVSEPVSEYIRFEYDGTFTNVHAGELVRWLPRRQAPDVRLPGNDFWLIDGELVLWNHFGGDGRPTEEVEHAYVRWLKWGRPDITRFGLTVTPEAHMVWLDDPGSAV